MSRIAVLVDGLRLEALSPVAHEHQEVVLEEFRPAVLPGLQPFFNRSSIEAPIASDFEAGQLALLG